MRFGHFRRNFGQFDTWFVAIGVTNPHMRERLFSVFDGDNDRFISFEEFEQGLRTLVAGKVRILDFNSILIRI